MTRRQQGHPARTNRDELTVEIERLATRVTRLVPQIIRDPRFDPEDVIVSKAGSVAMLHLLAVLSGKPTPAELYGYGKHGYHLAKLAAGHADTTHEEMARAIDKAAKQLQETS